jgi:hypothetical protein
MKKVALCAVLAFAAVATAAQAETITLAPSGCGLTRSCTPETDTGAVVTLSAAYGNYVRVYVDGVLYSSVGFQQLANFDSYPLFAADGSPLSFTAHFTTSRVCTRSGRGQTCHASWYLTGGSLVR